MGAALQADGETRSACNGLKHQKEKRSMDHFAGLDVSVKETSVCIVDDTGRIVREVRRTFDIANQEVLHGLDAFVVRHATPPIGF